MHQLGLKAEFHQPKICETVFMNNNRLDQFRTRFRQLRESSVSLANSMRESSRALAEFGKPSSPLLIAQMRQFHNEYRNLRDWSDGERHAKDGLPTTSSSKSLSELEREFESREIIGAALAKLDRIESIRWKTEDVPQCWQRCLGDCQSLRQDLLKRLLTERVSRAEEILREDHPFSAIAELVSEDQMLSDERWEHLNDIVVRSYGRDLLTAIVRGRLALQA